MCAKGKVKCSRKHKTLHPKDRSGKNWISFLATLDDKVRMIWRNMNDFRSVPGMGITEIAKGYSK